MCGQKQNKMLLLRKCYEILSGRYEEVILNEDRRTCQQTGGNPEKNQGMTEDLGLKAALMSRDEKEMCLTWLGSK